MTAQVFTAVVRDPSTFSLEKKNRGSASLDAAAVTALGALTTSDSVVDVLDILSAATKADYVVTTNQSGRATSVLN